ncbi:MAG: transposase [Deltaproteobacteria bacterium]|nr:transposase [Deltaproteobacteria bacterium]
MTRKRKRYGTEFKAKVALEAIREQHTVAEIARRYKVHVNMVYKWKRQLVDNLSRVFDEDSGSGEGASEREGELLKKIEELTGERDFLSQGVGPYR